MRGRNLGIFLSFWSGNPQAFKIRSITHERFTTFKSVMRRMNYMIIPQIFIVRPFVEAWLSSVNRPDEGCS